jgi:signal transduction histidine kinase
MPIAQPKTGRASKRVNPRRPSEPPSAVDVAVPAEKTDSAKPFLNPGGASLTPVERLNSGWEISLKEALEKAPGMTVAEACQAISHSGAPRFLARVRPLGEEDAGSPYVLMAAEDVSLLLQAVSELREHEARVRNDHTRLRELTARLIAGQESTNQALAQELHDVISQKLVVLALEVTALGRRPPKSMSALRQWIHHFGDEIGKAAGHIHELSRGLHPTVIEDLGLETALKAECESFFLKHNVPCALSASRLSEPIPGDVALCLYRIAQEGLRNAGQHAAAEAVEIRVARSDDAIEMTIVDFGRGLQVDAPRNQGLGLVSIEERVRMIGGQFAMTSAHGQGTTLWVRAPLPKGAYGQEANNSPGR